MADDRDKSYRLRMLLVCLVVLLLLLAFFYDLFHNQGKSGEAVGSLTSVWTL
jgi:hypothetical protein